MSDSQSLFSIKAGGIRRAATEKSIVAELELVAPLSDFRRQSAGRAMSVPPPWYGFSRAPTPDGNSVEKPVPTAYVGPRPPADAGAPSSLSRRLGGPIPSTGHGATAFMVRRWA